MALSRSLTIIRSSVPWSFFESLWPFLVSRKALMRPFTCKLVEWLSRFRPRRGSHFGRNSNAAVEKAMNRLKDASGAIHKLKTFCTSKRTRRFSRWSIDCSLGWMSIFGRSKKRSKRKNQEMQCQRLLKSLYRILKQQIQLQECKKSTIQTQIAMIGKGIAGQKWCLMRSPPIKVITLVTQVISLPLINTKTTTLSFLQTTTMTITLQRYHSRLPLAPAEQASLTTTTMDHFNKIRPTDEIGAALPRRASCSHNSSVRPMTLWWTKLIAILIWLCHQPSLQTICSAIGSRPPLATPLTTLSWPQLRWIGSQRAAKKKKRLPRVTERKSRYRSMVYRRHMPSAELHIPITA